MQILIVCGAGASSTFVAQRLRRAAGEAGLNWNVTAGTEADIPSATADLLLLGPHLSARTDELRAASAAHTAPLPDDIFADLTGARTLELCRALLPSKGTS